MRGSVANPQVAAHLDEAASLLEAQDANPFRVAAYRRAAETVRALDKPLASLVATNGMDGLVALPGIGRGIGAAIFEMVALGRWTQLERLRGDTDPCRVMRGVPGIGPRLAERLHDELHLDSLESLEQAAHDGRLNQVPGIGPRRAAGIAAGVASLLARRAKATPTGVRPSVSMLLSVDAEYRRRAAAGELRTIAPRRFNPGGKRWLPVMHTDRDGWHFTALYSNTARAHELSRTRDWVILYCYDGDHREQQYTVVTETRGKLSGRRVVRGRESDCRRHYAREAGAPSGVTGAAHLAQPARDE